MPGSRSSFRCRLRPCVAVSIRGSGRLARQLPRPPRGTRRHLRVQRIRKTVSCSSPRSLHDRVRRVDVWRRLPVARSNAAGRVSSSPHPDRRKRSSESQATAASCHCFRRVSAPQHRMVVVRCSPSSREIVTSAWHRISLCGCALVRMPQTPSPLRVPCFAPPKPTYQGAKRTSAKRSALVPKRSVPDNG